MDDDELKARFDQLEAKMDRLLGRINALDPHRGGPVNLGRAYNGYIVNGGCGGPGVPAQNVNDPSSSDPTNPSS